MSDTAAERSIPAEVCQDVDLTPLYPPSMLFVVKKGLPWFIILLAIIICVEWGPSDPDPFRRFLSPWLNLEAEVFYYAAFAVWLYKISMAALFRATMCYRISENSLLVRKGIIRKVRMDFPLGRINNLALKRDLLDVVLGICSVDVNSANAETASAGVIPGLSLKVGQQLERYLHHRVNVAQGGKSEYRPEWAQSAR